MAEHLVEHIVCLTDLTPASLPAFHHALALALANRAQLTLLHVGPQHQDQVDWSAFPRVRQTLVRWGRLPADSDNVSVAALGLEVRKQTFRDTSLIQGVKAFLRQHHVDLVVAMSTPGGRRRLGEPGIEQLVRANLTHLLVIRPGDGFVDADSGQCLLSRVVMPVAGRPHPSTATRLCAQVLPALCASRPAVTLLHVGSRGTAPDLALDESVVDWCWEFVQGKVQQRIGMAMREQNAGLLVMPSAGRPGLWQALRASHAEQALYQSKRPVLAIASGY